MVIHLIARRIGTIQIIGHHQQLQAHIRRDFHIWYVSCPFVFFIIIKILADFFQKHTTVRIRMYQLRSRTIAARRQTAIACKGVMDELTLCQGKYSGQKRLLKSYLHKTDHSALGPSHSYLSLIERTKDLGLTRRIKHCLDGFRMVCTIATHDEFKAVGRYEGNMRRGLGNHNCGVSRGDELLIAMRRG